jgi:hypothetical protein
MAAEEFLGSRGMGSKPRGRKSGAAVEAKPVEAQPATGQISHKRGRDGEGLASRLLGGTY